MKQFITIMLAILLCCGCSGGGEFVAETGPFNGGFTSENGESIGAFSFTVINNVLQGTGVINHNGDNITVTISAALSGKVINGQVNNSTFGAGPLWGTFDNVSYAEGGFTFTGNAGVATTTGTWSAAIP